MKICAIICEYNPFHNGHLHHIQTAKKLSGADKVVCIMSGNFVQRGEAAILEKRTRAKHAIQAGANAILELPTIYATSSAEFFAKGAIQLLSAIPNVTTLCFGAETPDKNAFLASAKLLLNEPKEVSLEIKRLLADGVSFVKARASAYEKYIQNEVLLKPNNLLGVEYTKAILQSNAKIDILPIERKGSGYSEKNLTDNFSSATAIREAIKQNEYSNLFNNLPEFTHNDMHVAKTIDLATLEKFAVLNKSKEELANITDCNEGLENAFKTVAEQNLSDFESKLTSPRYTTARIRRIALHALLGIEEQFIRTALSQPLYLRVLALKKGDKDILSLLGKSTYPLIVKNSDAKKLVGTAKEVFLKEEFADQVFAIASGNSPLYHNPLV